MGSSPTGGGFFDAQTSTQTATTSRRLAFPASVCPGNIIRSPEAEGVFFDIVKRRGLDGRFCIDSAGTINFPEGNPADSRMRAVAKERGIEIASMSRPIRPSDFSPSISKTEDILAAFSRWKFRVSLPENGHKKVKKLLGFYVRLMCLYCKKHDESEVPDPYYGGLQGFKTVLDLLEYACESLLESILEGNALASS